MAKRSIKTPWNLVFPAMLYDKLQNHLYPGDGDEHAAIVIAGIANTSRGTRLLVREVHLAEDGIHYVPGKRGYKMLKAEFIQQYILACHDERLVYLAVHNHSGKDVVEFSQADLDSHQRGYQALLDIVQGMPVGALVFAKNAVAGEIWLPNGQKVTLEGAYIIGSNRKRLTPYPLLLPPQRDESYDRQARLFGDAGQDILNKSKVGIIGQGGAGNLLAVFLAKLGVGAFVLVDPDRVNRTNLPRLIGATMLDALGWFDQAGTPQWLRMLARRWALPKVELGRRNIKQANKKASIKTFFSDCLDVDIAKELADCDYLFLAADTTLARLVFNSLVHQYLILGVQVGAKVQLDKATGAVIDVFSVVRPVTPEKGCLWCNGLIKPDKLQQESISEKERQVQAYVDDPTVIAPSVITLNAVAAAHAADDFMLYLTGLRDKDSNTEYMVFRPSSRDVSFDEPRQEIECTQCGTGSRSCLAKGDAIQISGIKYRYI